MMPLAVNEPSLATVKLNTGAAAPVFSFTVAQDGSFTANGIIVQGSPETESGAEITEAEAAAVPA